jgi:GNAT superfamily N-acetyltransferase
LSQFQIREFDNKDSESVFRFISDIVGKEFNIKIDLRGLDSDLLHVREYYNKDDVGCFGIAEIKDSNKIIGTAAIRNLKQFHSACELKRMFVLKKYRKLGIGQKMLDVALDFARKVDYSKILLYSSTDLKAARMLYLKNGFVDIQRYNDDYRADVFMQRQL